MKHSSLTLVGLVGASVVAGMTILACDADPAETGGGSGGAGPTGTGTTTTTTNAGGNGTGTGVGGEGGSIFTTTGGGGAPVVCDPGTLDDDIDQDGLSENQGDCNDCDANVNPNAVEVIDDGGDGEGGAPPGTPVDEDCDTVIDNVAPPCDDTLALDSADPMDAARAMDLCKFVSSAKWALADGADPAGVLDAAQLASFHLGHGNIASLGPENTPWKGQRLLALSSGTARNENEAGFVHRNYDKKYGSGSPVGFPKEGPACPGVITEAPHDATGVELVVTAPSNAKSFSFVFNFFTYEWPQYICTTFNDFFVANLVPFPNGQADGNVSFDLGNNPISVNNAFLDVCGCPSGAPCVVPPAAPAKSFDCPLGVTGLSGTDFDVDTTPGWTNGSTGWLQTTAPIEVAPGQTFTLRLVTYDSSDGNVDSTTIIDNWTWHATPGLPVTEHVDPPE